MTTKKEFFKYAATALLMPGGFLLAAALSVLIAMVLAVAMYVAFFFCVACWIVSCVRELASDFAKSFGKAARTKERGTAVGHASRPPHGAGLPEDSLLSPEDKVWDTIQRKWLQ